jgi:hypothetical protein
MYQLSGSYLNDGTFGKNMEGTAVGRRSQSLRIKVPKCYVLKCQNVALTSLILRTIPLNDVPSSKLINNGCILQNGDSFCDSVNNCIQCMMFDVLLSKSQLNAKYFDFLHCNLTDRCSFALF